MHFHSLPSNLRLAFQATTISLRKGGIIKKDNEVKIKTCLQGHFPKMGGMRGVRVGSCGGCGGESMPFSAGVFSLSIGLGGH